MTPHDERGWVFRLTSVTPVDTSEQIKKANLLEASAVRAHQDAERQRTQVSFERYKALQRAAYDLERDAKRLRAQAEKPDLVIAGVDHKNRRVTARVPHRWTQPLAARRPGDVITVRGKAEVLSDTRLTITEAVLITE